MAGDVSTVLRMESDRAPDPEPSAAVDSPTLPLSPESGEWADCDRAERERGPKVHLAADTADDVVALHVTPAHADGHGAVTRLAAEIQAGDGGRAPRTPPSTRAISRRGSAFGQARRHDADHRLHREGQHHQRDTSVHVAAPRHHLPHVFTSWRRPIGTIQPDNGVRSAPPLPGAYSSWLHFFAGDRSFEGHRRWISVAQRWWFRGNGDLYGVSCI